MHRQHRHHHRTPLVATLAANSVSTAGTSLTLIGVPWFVLETTGSAGRAGLVAFCATLPIVLAALIGGPFIDRIGRRRVAVASDTVCGLAIAAIPLLHHVGALEFWMLCALMALNGFAHTPGNTARYVLIPDLAEHAGTTLPRAASLFDAVSRGARMTGAALAGVLIAFAGSETVLLLDAATFGLSALLVAIGVRGVGAAEPRKAEAPVSLRTYGSELREGYAHLLGHRLLLAVVVMVMFMNGTDQGWNAVLLPVHAEAELGGARDIGLLTALFGAGGLTGALLYGAVGHRFSRRAVFTVCVILCGAPRFLVAGVTGTVLPLAVTMLLGGIAGGLLVEGMGPSGALLAMGGVYFLATLSPLVFPSWRTMEGPGPGVDVAAREVSVPSEAGREVSIPPSPPQVSSSAPSRRSPAP
ncbi:MFS transporter [Streptomyces bacillaris]|uniref:MFS transporter n=1 Tax=Streptomyces bacillaris TaxID=68179 RepID=UPI0036FCC945